MGQLEVAAAGGLVDDFINGIKITVAAAAKVSMQWKNVTSGDVDDVLHNTIRGKEDIVNRGQLAELFQQGLKLKSERLVF